MFRQQHGEKEMKLQNLTHKYKTNLWKKGESGYKFREHKGYPRKWLHKGIFTNSENTKDTLESDCIRAFLPSKKKMASYARRKMMQSQKVLIVFSILHKVDTQKHKRSTWSYQTQPIKPPTNEWKKTKEKKNRNKIRKRLNWWNNKRELLLSLETMSFFSLDLIWRIPNQISWYL